MRQATVARVLRVVWSSGVVVFAAAGASFGQEADVKAAIVAYHNALEAVDASKMEALWAHDANVFLVNPANKSISVGWDAVKENWEKMYSGVSELKLTQTDGPHIQVNGDVAWSMGLVNAEGKLKSGPGFSSPTFETDVFEKRDGKWLLVSHTASRVPELACSTVDPIWLAEFQRARITAVFA
jgi:ketosteroid isomerase-like protein